MQTKFFESYTIPHPLYRPLPVSSRRLNAPTRSSAPCLDTFSADWIMPVETSGRDSTRSTSAGNFELACDFPLSLKNRVSMGSTGYAGT